ncbi:Iron-regulated protein FrpC [Diplonema papillatum]|nr:Iron-regulated protein FrpC [Diplonema papillatum]
MDIKILAFALASVLVPGASGAVSSCSVVDAGRLARARGGIEAVGEVVDRLRARLAHVDVALFGGPARSGHPNRLVAESFGLDTTGIARLNDTQDASLKELQDALPGHATLTCAVDDETGELKLGLSAMPSFGVALHGSWNDLPALTVDALGLVFESAALSLEGVGSVEVKVTLAIPETGPVAFEFTRARFSFACDRHVSETTTWRSAFGAVRVEGPAAVANGSVELAVPDAGSPAELRARLPEIRAGRAAGALTAELQFDACAAGFNVSSRPGATLSVRTPSIFATSPAVVVVDAGADAFEAAILQLAAQFESLDDHLTTRLLAGNLTAGGGQVEVHDGLGALLRSVRPALQRHCGRVAGAGGVPTFGGLAAALSDHFAAGARSLALASWNVSGGWRPEVRAFTLRWVVDVALPLDRAHVSLRDIISGAVQPAALKDVLQFWGTGGGLGSGAVSFVDGTFTHAANARLDVSIGLPYDPEAGGVPSANDGFVRIDELSVGVGAAADPAAFVADLPGNRRLDAADGSVSVHASARCAAHHATLLELSAGGGLAPALGAMPCRRRGTVGLGFRLAVTDADGAVSAHPGFYPVAQYRDADAFSGRFPGFTLDVDLSFFIPSLPRGDGEPPGLSFPENKLDPLTDSLAAALGRVGGAELHFPRVGTLRRLFSQFSGGSVDFAAYMAEYAALATAFNQLEHGMPADLKLDLATSRRLLGDDEFQASLLRAFNESYPTVFSRFNVDGLDEATGEAFDARDFLRHCQVYFNLAQSLPGADPAFSVDQLEGILALSPHYAMTVQTAKALLSAAHTVRSGFGDTDATGFPVNSEGFRFDPLQHLPEVCQAIRLPASCRLADVAKRLSTASSTEGANREFQTLVLDMLAARVPASFARYSAVSTSGRRYDPSTGEVFDYRTHATAVAACLGLATGADGPQEYPLSVVPLLRSTFDKHPSLGGFFRYAADRAAAGGGGSVRIEAPAVGLRREGPRIVLAAAFSLAAAGAGGAAAVDATAASEALFSDGSFSVLMSDHAGVVATASSVTVKMGLEAGVDLTALVSQDGAAAGGGAASPFVHLTAFSYEAAFKSAAGELPAVEGSLRGAFDGARSAFATLNESAAPSLPASFQAVLGSRGAFAAVFSGAGAGVGPRTLRIVAPSAFSPEAAPAAHAHVVDRAMAGAQVQRLLQALDRMQAVGAALDGAPPLRTAIPGLGVTAAGIVNATAAGGGWAPLFSWGAGLRALLDTAHPTCVGGGQGAAACPTVLEVVGALGETIASAGRDRFSRCWGDKGSVVGGDVLKAGAALDVFELSFEAGVECAHGAPVSLADFTRRTGVVFDGVRPATVPFRFAHSAAISGPRIADGAWWTTIRSVTLSIPRATHPIAANRARIGLLDADLVNASSTLSFEFRGDFNNGEPMSVSNFDASTFRYASTGAASTCVAVAPQVNGRAVLAQPASACLEAPEAAGLFAAAPQFAAAGLDALAGFEAVGPARVLTALGGVAAAAAEYWASDVFAWPVPLTGVHVGDLAAGARAAAPLEKIGLLRADPSAPLCVAFGSPADPWRGAWRSGVEVLLNNRHRSRVAFSAAEAEAAAEPARLQQVLNGGLREAGLASALRFSVEGVVTAGVSLCTVAAFRATDLRVWVPGREMLGGGLEASAPRLPTFSTISELSAILRRTAEIAGDDICSYVQPANGTEQAGDRELLFAFRLPFALPSVSTPVVVSHDEFAPFVHVKAEGDAVVHAEFELHGEFGVRFAGTPQSARVTYTLPEGSSPADVLGRDFGVAVLVDGQLRGGVLFEGEALLGSLQRVLAELAPFAPGIAVRAFSSSNRTLTVQADGAARLRVELDDALALAQPDGGAGIHPIFGALAWSGVAAAVVSAFGYSARHSVFDVSGHQGRGTVSIALEGSFPAHGSPASLRGQVIRSEYSSFSSSAAVAADATVPSAAAAAAGLPAHEFTARLAGAAAADLLAADFRAAAPAARAARFAPRLAAVPSSGVPALANLTAAGVAAAAARGAAALFGAPGVAAAALAVKVPFLQAVVSDATVGAQATLRKLARPPGPRATLAGFQEWVRRTSANSSSACDVSFAIAEQQRLRATLDCTFEGHHLARISASEWAGALEAVPSASQQGFFDPDGSLPVELASSSRFQLTLSFPASGAPVLVADASFSVSLRAGVQRENIVLGLGSLRLPVSRLVYTLGGSAAGCGAFAEGAAAFVFALNDEARATALESLQPSDFHVSATGAATACVRFAFDAENEVKLSVSDLSEYAKHPGAAASSAIAAPDLERIVRRLKDMHESFDPGFALLEDPSTFTNGLTALLAWVGESIAGDGSELAGLQVPLVGDHARKAANELFFASFASGMAASIREHLRLQSCAAVGRPACERDQSAPHAVARAIARASRGNSSFFLCDPTTEAPLGGEIPLEQAAAAVRLSVRDAAGRRVDNAVDPATGSVGSFDLLPGADAVEWEVVVGGEAEATRELSVGVAAGGQFSLNLTVPEAAGRVSAGFRCRLVFGWSRTDGVYLATQGLGTVGYVKVRLGDRDAAVLSGTASELSASARDVGTAFAGWISVKVDAARVPQRRLLSADVGRYAAGMFTASYDFGGVARLNLSLASSGIPLVRAGLFSQSRLSSSPAPAAAVALPSDFGEIPSAAGFPELLLVDVRADHAQLAARLVLPVVDQLASLLDPLAAVFDKYSAVISKGAALEYQSPNATVLDVIDALEAVDPSITGLTSGARGYLAAFESVHRMRTAVEDLLESVGYEAPVSIGSYAVSAAAADPWNGALPPGFDGAAAAAAAAASPFAGLLASSPACNPPIFTAAGALAAALGRAATLFALRAPAMVLDVAFDARRADLAAGPFPHPPRVALRAGFEADFSVRPRRGAVLQASGHVSAVAFPELEESRSFFSTGAAGGDTELLRPDFEVPLAACNDLRGRMLEAGAWLLVSEEGARKCYRSYVAAAGDEPRPALVTTANLTLHIGPGAGARVAGGAAHDAETVTIREVEGPLGNGLVELHFESFSSEELVRLERPNATEFFGSGGQAGDTVQLLMPTAAGTFSGGSVFKVDYRSSLVSIPSGTLSDTSLTGFLLTGTLAVDGFDRVELFLTQFKDTLRIVVMDATSITGFGMLGEISCTDFVKWNFDVPSSANLTIHNTHAGAVMITGGVGAEDIFIKATTGLLSLITGDGRDFLFFDVPGTLLGPVIVDTGRGTDLVEVSLAGSGALNMTISDSGSMYDEDEVRIFGTAAPDTFLCRSDFVALVPVPAQGTDVERIDFASSFAGMVKIYGGDGPDTFVFDGTPSAVFAYGGRGSDRFVVGQELRAATDVLGHMTDGNHHRLTCHGGDDDDFFSIGRNLAPVRLLGGSGRDRFLVNYIVPNVTNPAAALSPVYITGEEGDDYVAYKAGSIVAAAGGVGIDELVIFGTDGPDTFVVTGGNAYGANVSVVHDGFEKFQLNTLAGDDEVTMLDMPERTAATVAMGLGSDTFFLTPANKSTTAMGRDTRGHSAVIQHVVSSADEGYNGIPVEGIAARVADEDAPGVVVIAAGIYHLFEDSTGPAEYSLFLAKKPTSTVIVVIEPPEPADIPNARTLSVYPAVLLFTETDWKVPQTVSVDARPGDGLEPETVYFLVHEVIQTGGSMEYHNLDVSPVRFRVIDADAVGIYYVPHSPSHRISEGGEGGVPTTYSYDVHIKPCRAGWEHSVLVDATMSFRDRGEVTVTPSSFRLGYYVEGTEVRDHCKRTIQIEAVDDSVVDGIYSSYVSFRITDGGLHFPSSPSPAARLPYIPVEIIDNDTPFVIITETNEHTLVTESGTTDTYTVHLTRKPSHDVTVTPVLKDGQVTVFPTLLRFSPDNYASPQTVTVTAVQDNVVDDVPALHFPSQPSTLHKLQGALTVEGGHGFVLSFVVIDPIVLPGETSEPNSWQRDLGGDDAAHVDRLFVFDSDSIAAPEAYHWYQQLVGLGMGSFTTLFQDVGQNGIKHADMEVFDVTLGASDNVIAEVLTPQTPTIFRLGGGNDRVRLSVVVGPLFFDAGPGNDTFVFEGVFSNILKLDDVASISGGAGHDTITFHSGASNPAGDAGVVSRNRITGFGMRSARTNGLPSAQFITIRGSSGNFTLSLEHKGSVHNYTFAVGTPADVLEDTLRTTAFALACEDHSLVRCQIGFAVYPVDVEGASAYTIQYPTEVALEKAGLLFWVDTSAVVGEQPEYFNGTDVNNLPLTIGVVFGSIEEVNIELAEKNGGALNVRGTSAPTRVFSSGGDDTVAVSSESSLLTAQQARGAMYLSGILAYLDHPLSIDNVGGAPNRLLVSDSMGAVGRLKMFIEESTVKNFAPVTIEYLGNFTRGVAFWTTDFYDEVEVFTSPLGQPMPPIVLNMGPGDDTVEIDLFDDRTGGFVVNCGAGDDVVDAVLTTVPLFVFGGSGDDTIVSGRGSDVIFCDEGRLEVTAGGGTVVLGDAASVPGFDGAISLVSAWTNGCDEQGGGDVVFSPYPGSDVVFGGAGNDFVTTAGLAGEAIFGDFGTVTWDPSLGAVNYAEATCNATGGDDTLSATARDVGGDMVFGGFGADRITVASGAAKNVVFGDFGRAAAAGSAAVPVVTYAESTLPGAGGPDQLKCSGSNSDAGDIIFGGAGADLIDAGPGNDTVFGDYGRYATQDKRGVPHHNAASLFTDNFAALGNDTIQTHDGTDIVIAGQGEDTVDGGDGDDYILGDFGEVLMTFDYNAVLIYPKAGADAANGDDDITGGPGNDVLAGCGGSDVMRGDGGDDVLFGDFLEFEGGVHPANRDYEVWSELPLEAGGADALYGGDGVDVLVGGQAADVAFGGEGGDYIAGDHAEMEYVSRHSFDQFQSEDAASGSGDQLQGEEGDDVLIGGAGDDYMDGGLGEDIMFGDEGKLRRQLGLAALNTQSDEPSAAGNDVMFGGPGDDVMFGGLANDTIHAGDGDDYVVADQGTISLNAASGNRITTVTSIDGGHDTVFGGPGEDYIMGGGFADVLHGDDGDDVIFGDYGSYSSAPPTVFKLFESTFLADATAGADDVSGGAGADILVGGGGRDSISGGSEADWIFGDHAKAEINPQRNSTRFSCLAAGGQGRGDSDDDLRGDDGADRMFGGAGNDTADGGAGDDIIFGDFGVYESDQPLVFKAASSLTADTAGGSDSLAGGTGNDYLVGGQYSDDLRGDDGGDWLFGDHAEMWSYAAENYTRAASTNPEDLGAPDTLSGGSGSDVAVGGVGADELRGGGGADVLIGDFGFFEEKVAGAGAGERSYQTLFAEVFCADGPEAHGDLIVAGPDGAAVIAGQGSDTVVGGDGDDWVFGDHGRVSVAVDGGVTSVTMKTMQTDSCAGEVDVIDTGAGDDIIFGGAKGDNITAGDGDDVIAGDFAAYSLVSDGEYELTSTDPDGEGGPDLISGGNGDDLIVAGQGNDTITAGSGDDYAMGDHGDILVQTKLGVTLARSLFPTQGASDTILAGDGNDVVIGGPGSDDLDGDAGDDYILGDHGRHERQAGDIRCQSLFSSFLSDGGDTITGGPGDDRLIGGGGRDTVHGSSGSDLVMGDGALVIEFSDGFVHWETTDIGFADHDSLFGGEGNDVLFGSGGADVIHGGAGNDTVMADYAWLVREEGGYRKLQPLYVQYNRGVADAVDGGEGDDVIVGQQGGDVLNGSAGNDMIFGDQATVWLAFSHENHTVIKAESTASTNGLGGNDIIHAGDGDDYVFGGSLHDTIYGGDGQDVLLGDYGSFVSELDPTDPYRSILLGSAENAGDDEIHGGPGDDFILGQQGSDRIFGEAGDDDLTGGHNAAHGDDAGDAIEGGDGDDFILGDNGRIERDVVSSQAAPPFVWGKVFRTVSGVSSADRSVQRFDDIDLVSGDDVIDGGSGDDVVYGQRGSDTVDGQAGDDSIVGGLGHDVLKGGSGNDVMIGDVGDIRYALLADGTARVNNRTGSRHRDIILEEPGRILQYHPSATTKHFTPQEAALLFDADVLLSLGGHTNSTARDKSFVQTGTCTSTSTVDNPSSVVQSNCRDPWDTAVAGLRLEPSGDDVMSGDDGDDVMIGQRGDDQLSGGAGNDFMYGDGVSSSYFYASDIPLVTNVFRLLSVAGDDTPLRVASFGTVVSAPLTLTPEQAARSSALPSLEQASVATVLPHALSALHSWAKVADIERTDVAYGMRAYASIIPDAVGHAGMLQGNDMLNGGDGEDVLVGDTAMYHCLVNLDVVPLEQGRERAVGLWDELQVRLARASVDLATYANEAVAKGAAVNVAQGNDELIGSDGNDLIVGDALEAFVDVLFHGDVDGNTADDVAMGLMELYSDYEILAVDAAQLVYEAHHAVVKQLYDNRAAGVLAAESRISVSNDVVNGSSGNDVVAGDSLLLVVKTLAQPSDFYKTKQRSSVRTAALADDLKARWQSHVLLDLSPSSSLPGHTLQSRKAWNRSPLTRYGCDVIHGAGGNDSITGDFAMHFVDTFGGRGYDGLTGKSFYQAMDSSHVSYLDALSLKLGSRVFSPNRFQRLTAATGIHEPLSLYNDKGSGASAVSEPASTSLSDFVSGGGDDDLLVDSNAVSVLSLDHHTESDIPAFAGWNGGYSGKRRLNDLNTWHGSSEGVDSMSGDAGQNIVVSGQVDAARAAQEPSTQFLASFSSAQAWSFMDRQFSDIWRATDFLSLSQDGLPTLDSPPLFQTQQHNGIFGTVPDLKAP